MKSPFFSSLNDCIDFIKSRNEKLGIRFGLERISKTLKHLNDPHKKYKTIHIAGTNGRFNDDDDSEHTTRVWL